MVDKAFLKSIVIFYSFYCVSLFIDWWRQTSKFKARVHTVSHPQESICPTTRFPLYPPVGHPSPTRGNYLEG